MPLRPTEVGVVIVSYNGREDLEACLRSLFESNDVGVCKRLVVVDNGSTDGAVELLETEFPHIDRVLAGVNLGFAEGNNRGWEYVAQRYPEAQYVALLNQDTLVESGWLSSLVDYLESHPDVGCAQAKIKLYPRTEAFNTVGNRSHFLGFGFTTGYGEHDYGQYDQPAAIDFASGAALLVRSSLVRELGLFDPLLFMYMEDVELGWKLRQVGQEIAYVPASCVYHKYTFNSDYKYYYYLERNRWWLLLTYYKTGTLLLLAPALAAMELGQLVFAWRRGRLRDKVRSVAFLLQRENLRRLRERRRAAQARRKIRDREFLARFSGRIETPELQGFLIRWIANPVLGLYWSIARRLIFW